LNRGPSEHLPAAEALRDSPFLRACRREPVDRTPVWLMRQAGRYMREYREVRAKVGFLELCKTPALAAEVTVTALGRIGADAAILFADILLILEAMGLRLEFTKGDGPVLHDPVRTAADVDRLRPPPEGSLAYVMEAVALCRKELPADIPLIGFAGAPFTLASYAVEGGGSRDYARTKALMRSDPGAWNALMGRLADATAAYLCGQLDAGAQAIQLFDSWVGCLSPAVYREFVAPHSGRVIRAVKAHRPDAPFIHFGAGNPLLLEAVRDAGGDVIGIDYRTEMDEARRRLGPAVAVQGNLDPALLTADRDTVLRAAKDVIDRAAAGPGGGVGHVFNLGHGILPETPVDNVLALVEFVHGYRPG
jgi:uroporphyrinogen decarboxylase